MSEPKKFFSMHDPSSKEAQNGNPSDMLDKLKSGSLEHAERVQENLKRQQEIKPTTMKPLEDRLIIKPDVIDEIKTEAGLWVPEAVINRSQPARGTIVAAGPGLPGKEMPLKTGDRVMYGHYAGTNVEDPDTKELLLVLRFSDVFIKL